MSAPNQLHRKQLNELTAAQKLLPGGAAALAFTKGQAQYQMTTATWIVIGVFFAAFIFAFVNGVIIYPSLLVLLIILATIRPWRGLCVTPQGTALMSFSIMFGKPKRVLMLTSNAVLMQPAVYAPSKRKVAIPIGRDTVTIKRQDYDRLIAVLAPLPQPVQQSTAPAPGYSAAP